MCVLGEGGAERGQQQAWLPALQDNMATLKHRLLRKGSCGLSGQRLGGLWL